MDPVTGEVLDFVGGRKDLEAHLVRAIGDPERRFAEDKLRMLRAVRFAARFAFKIDPETLDAIRVHAHEINEVSAERIREELVNIFLAPARVRGWCDLGINGSFWIGTAIGAIDIVSISDKVPADVKTKVEGVKSGLKDGSFVIWKGPITSNDGKEMLAAGTITAELSSLLMVPTAWPSRSKAAARSAGSTSTASTSGRWRRGCRRRAS